MNTTTLRTLLLVAVSTAGIPAAHALPPWKPKFQKMFVEEGPQSLQTAFANKEIGSCKVCHVNGEEKTVRNPFGIALDERIEGNAGTMLKEAENDESKAALLEKFNKQFEVALKDVLKQPSPSGGGTYGERIEAGKLPYVPAPVNELSEEEKANGWKLLFDGESADGWNSWKTKQPLELDQWVVEDGALTLHKGGGDIYTADAFENYELVLEWKSTGNSGILIRVDPAAGGAIYSVAPEMQIHNKMGSGSKSTAALYDIYPVEGQPPFNENGWNEVRIRTVNGEGTHWFNGQKVYTYKIGSDEWNERIAASKWKGKQGFGETARGHIGFQDHGAQVAFRNVKIRELDKDGN